MYYKSRDLLGVRQCFPIFVTFELKNILPCKLGKQVPMI